MPFARGDREILDLLNEGLAMVMADGTYRRLHTKWFETMELPLPRRIVIGGDQNYPPFEYLDEAGRPAGYNVELTRAIARALGLDIEIQLGPWMEMRQKLARGEIDAVQGMLYSTRRDLTFDFTAPHMVTHFVSVIRRGDGVPPAGVKDLRDKDIVVESGDIMHDFVLENRLTGRIAALDSQENALRELRSGKHDCALVGRLTALYYIEKYQWDDLVVGRQPILSPEYCYAVPQNHKVLQAQLGEGLKVLEQTGEYRRIYDKWLGVYEDSPLGFIDFIRYIAAVVIPLVLLLLAFFLWSRSLRRLVAHRTAELGKSMEQYRLLADNTIDVIWTMNLNLEFTYVNPAIRSLMGYSPEEWIGSPLRQHCDEAHFALMARIVSAVLDKGEKNTGVFFETELIKKNGDAIPVEIHGKFILDDSGRPLGLQGVTRDISERRKAEARLRRNEALMNAAQHIGKIGGWEYNLETRQIFWTDETYRLHDLNPDDFRPGSMEHITQSLDCYAKEDRKRIHAAFKRCVDKGEPYELECRFITAGGRNLWVRTSGQAVRDGNRVVKVIGDIQDITHNKQAEEQLRKQNQLIQTILENLPIGLAINYLDKGTAGIINKRFEEIYGWPAEEVPDVETFFEKVYPDPRYRAKIRERIMRDIESGDPERMNWDDIEITGKDGNKRIVSAKNIPISEQDIMISTVQDVTERKMAEAALLESEKRFRLLVESSPDAIFVHVDWRFAYLNQSAVSLFGATSTLDLLGASVLDRHQPDGYDVARDRIEMLYRQKIAVPLLEQVFLRLDGARVNVEVSAVPVNYQGGDGALVFVRDITERIEREKAHQHLREQLAQAQKMESVGRLAGGVAHDYNNMLGVIIGYSELALGRIDPGSPLQTDLMEIHKAANRSADITRQLLAFARQQTVAPKVLDLNDTVESMLKMLRRLIGEDIELAWLPGAGLWPVKIDPAQIDQIMANLCVNARDAIEGVGKISIETANVTFDDDYCANHAEFIPGDYVQLAVSDDGCGMDRDVLENVFEPFFTTKGVGVGTGLGLATVYGIVKQNSGIINIYSEPDKGTTIKIYLPGQAVAADGATRENASEIPLGHGERVLLVEDEPAIMNMGTLMLEKLGYNLLAADNPNKAIQYAEEQTDPLQLLITDVVMPEMNGRDLADRLRSIYPDIKVLFMSGYTANVIAHRGVLDEGVDFMQKPFSLKDLADKVRDVLEGDND